MILLPIGQIAYADADGRLPQVGRPKALAPWRDPLDAACEAVRETLADKAKAILIRGSIPRGTAIPGTSDLDLVIVHTGEIGNWEQENLRANERAIATNFSGVTDVEFLMVSEAEFGSGRKREWLRFILSHQGLTLWGEDLIEGLAPPYLDRRAVAHDRAGARWVFDWVEHWSDAKTEAARRSVCSWLMKRYVRAAFERIIFDLNGYTRDLYPAAEAVANRCPAHADDVWSACRLAVFPSADRDVVHRSASGMQALLDDYGLARRGA